MNLSRLKSVLSDRFILLSKHLSGVTDLVINQFSYHKVINNFFVKLIMPPNGLKRKSF